MATEQVGQKRKEEVDVTTGPLGGQPFATKGPESLKKYLQLVEHTWADRKLKQRLLDDPKSVLQEYGLEVPEEVEVRVVESTDKVLYLTLPRQPTGDAGELTSGQLSRITGGATMAEYGWIGHLIDILISPIRD
jgi:hypothetical protein